MRVKFWGVRADISTPGRATERVGGNTVCLELRDRAGEVFIIEAGNGLYPLGRSLLGSPLGKGRGQAALILSGTHWDRIQGFPFFVPIFIPGNNIQIFASNGTETQLENILEGQMQPQYSPIASLSNLGAHLEFESLKAGPAKAIQGLSVCLEGGPGTLLRVAEAGRALVYCIDVDYRAVGTLERVAAFARGADLLIHEAYYENDEARTLARASFREATLAALHAEVPRLLYFYHHPDHSDARVEAAIAAERSEILRRMPPRALIVDTAREGQELQLEEEAP